MPSFRRPPRTLISGFGVAGAVLAAVVVAFTVVSGFVAYSLTTVDPLPRSSGALVLDPLRPGAVVAEPLVLRPAPATRRRAAAKAGAARSGIAGARAQSEGRSHLAGHRSGAELPPHGAGSADRPATPSAPAAPAHPAPDRLLKPVGEAVGATGKAVGATTDSLARRLDGVTAAVGARTEPVAATVEAATEATIDALRATADRSGKTVGRLLGAPPQR
jgi:hypothetical protein